MSITGIRAARAYVELVMNDNKFTRGLALAEAEMRAFANKCTAIGSQMFGMGAAMLTPIAYSVRQFKEFDDTMRLVRAVTRATMNDFQKLSDKARLLGKTTSFTSQQVADAMANLGRAGFDTKQIDGMIKHVMNLARATQTGIANSAEIVGNAMRQFGLQTKDTQKVVDVLTTTANNSSQTLDDIAQAMKYAAPIAKAFGLTIQDTAYYIGILANQGLRGEMAGTSLRNMLIRLSGADTQKKFTADLQVQIRDAEGRVKNIKQLLDEAGAAMNARGWDQLQRSKWLRDVFGLRAIAGGSKFVSVGDDFKYIMDAIADSEGAAERTAKQMDEGIGGAIRITISAFQELANVIGEAISPELIQFGKYLQGLANEWITYLKYHRNVVVEWTNFAAKIAKWGALLFGLGSVVRTIGSVFGGFVSAGKNMMVYFKAFSKASGDVDVEMKKVGSDTRKAGYDFGLASGEFKAAAKNMTDAAVLAVKAGDHIKNANTNIAKGGVGAEKAAARAERAGAMFDTAAGHAKTAATAFASVNKQITDIGAVFTTAGTPMVNALKEFRKMVSFFSKSGESVVLAVQQIDALAGTLARFATSTNDAAYVFAQAAPVFSIYSRDLKSAGAAASKVLKAMGGFAAQAGEGVKTLGGAMETTAGAETTFASNTAAVVSELEQVAASATKAGAAVKSVGASMKGVQQYASPIGPVNLQQYSRPIGPMNVGGMINQKADIEKQLAVHKDNLNNYYGTEIPRVSAYLEQLRSNPVLNADEIIRTEAKLKRLEAEAQKVRGSAFSIYGRSANISKQLLGEGYTTYRTKAEREKYEFRGISVYQQAQNSLKRAEILAEIERENAPNKTPGSAPSSYEVRKQLAIDAKNKQQTIWSKGFTSSFKIDGNVTRQIQELQASQEQLEKIAQRNGLTKNVHGLWSSSNGRTSQKLADLVNKTDEKYQARLHSLVRYQQLFNSPLATMRTIDTDILSPYPLAEDKDWSKEITPKRQGLTAKQIREQQHLNVLMRRRASLVNRLHLNVLPTLSQDPSEQYKQLAESRKMQQRWAGQLAYVDKMIKDYGNRGVVAASQQLGSSKDADIAKLSVKPTEGAARAAALATAKYNEMKAATDQAGASLQKTGEAAKKTTPAVVQTGNAAKQGGAGFAVFSRAAKTAGLAAIGFTKALGGMLLFSAAFQGIWWAIGKLKEGSKTVTDMQENLDKLKASFSEDNTRITRLNEINNSHAKTNELLDEAANIVGELQSKYGNLGLSVNRATKSVEGLKNATEELRKAQSESEELATDKAIKELQDNQAKLRKQGESFTNMLLGAYTPNEETYAQVAGMGTGSPGYVRGSVRHKYARNSWDTSDFLARYGGNTDQLFSNPDWRELLKPYLDKLNVSEADQQSLFAKTKPLAYRDEFGQTMIADIEETNELRTQAHNYNKLMDQLRTARQQEAEYQEMQDMRRNGVTQYSIPEARAITMAYANQPYLGGASQLTSDELLAGIKEGKFASLSPKDLEAYRINLENAIDAEYAKREGAVASLGQFRKGIGVSLPLVPELQQNLFSMLGMWGEGFNGSNMIGANIRLFDDKVAELQTAIQSSLSSGGEEDQALKIRMLTRLQNFYAEYRKAIEEGTAFNFDFTKYADLSSYELFITAKDSIDTLRRERDRIIDATMQEATAFKVMEGDEKGNTKWRIHNYDSAGNFIGLSDQEVYEPQKNNILRQRAASRVAVIDAKIDELQKAGDYAGAQSQVRAADMAIRDLSNELQSLPERVKQGTIEAFANQRDALFRKAGLGDELAYRFKEIDKQAEELRIGAEETFRQARERGDSVLENLPIDDWLTAQYNGINQLTNALREQATLELAGDETARRGVEQTHEYLVEILRRMDRDYILQKGRTYGQYGYVNTIEQRKAANAEEEAVMNKAAEDRAQAAKDAGELIDDKYDPDEWLKQKRAEHARIRKIQDKGAYSYFGVPYEDDTANIPEPSANETQGVQAMPAENVDNEPVNSPEEINLGQDVPEDNSIASIRERKTQQGVVLPERMEQKQTFWGKLRNSSQDKKSYQEIGNLEKQYDELKREYGQDAADEYQEYLQSLTDENLPAGQRIGTSNTGGRRTWIDNADKKAQEIKRQRVERDADEAYTYGGTPYDYMNDSIQRDIDAARTRQGIAQQMGNEQGAAEEEAYIKQLEQQKAANKYYKELDNIERLEKNRNNDLEQYQKDQKEVDKQEKKINKMKKKNLDVTEEEAKLAEMEQKRDASRDKYLASNEQFGNSANYIAAMNAYGNVRAQQQLWDINRSFSSKGTFDAYETGGQDVSTWTAEFKEQTTILGNIEDYLATMASGEYL